MQVLSLVSLSSITDAISTGLDYLLDNLLVVLNALAYIIWAPFKFVLMKILVPMFSYILHAIFGNTLGGVAMFLGVLILVVVAFWAIYSFPVVIGTLAVLPFAGGVFLALTSLFRFGAKTLLAAGIIWAIVKIGRLAAKGIGSLWFKVANATHRRA